MARRTARRDFLATSTLGVVAAASGGAAALPTPLQTIRYTRVVDLTHALDPSFPTFGGQAQFRMETTTTLDAEGWNTHRWHIDEHTGTHLDAPFHKSNHDTADRIPAVNLVGPLVVVDVRAKAERNPDAELTPDDLQSWIKKHGPIPQSAIVAMRSGWDTHVRSPRFRNADSNNTLHFPGFHREAAELLLTEHDIKGIIVDTLSLDPGRSTDFPVHIGWLGANRWGLECAANLADLPPTGATVVVGAPRVTGASGGPTRVLALV